MCDEQLVKRIERTAQQCVWDLCDHFGLTVPKFGIHWDLVGPDELGTATGDHLIRLHPTYCEALGCAYEQTVMHEAAHIVTARRSMQRYANRSADWSPHGKEWERAMRLLGAEVVPHATTTEMALAASIDWA